MDTRATKARLRFGPFELDTAAGELHRGRERVRLQEHPRQVLEALLERPGEVVSRTALRERLWSQDTFVDFEHGLNTAIKKLRQALGDSADAPEFVETLARRGYRFIAPVQRVVSPPGADVPVPTELSHAAGLAAATTRRHAWLRDHAWWTLAAAVLLVAAMTAAVRFVMPHGDASAAAAAPVTSSVELAVLPLRVLPSPEPGDISYMGVGIAEAITTRLANVRQLRVRPISAVLPFRDGPLEPARIAAALRVGHLLVGTIQPLAGTWRVSVQLVEADGVAVWGRSYDEPRTDLLHVQDAIAEQVVHALRVELSPPEVARLHVRYTRDPVAYDLYLRGRARLVDYSEDHMREALDLFEQALARDPGYALARAALATGLAWFSVRYAYEEEANAWGARAEREGQQALSQDPSLADAHLALANAAGTLYGRFDWGAVLSHTSRALALDPSLDLAHVVRMRAFYHLGRLDEARAEAARVRTLNPFPNLETARITIAVHLAAGEFEQTATLASQVLGQTRTDVPAIRQYLAMARYYTGHVEEARAMLSGIRRGGHPDVRAQASLASIEAASGRRAEARRRIGAILRTGYMDHHVAYSLAAAYAQLRDPQASVTWLTRAADSGFPCVPYIEHDTLFAPVRDVPAFRALLRDLRARAEQAPASRPPLEPLPQPARSARDESVTAARGR
ncbi:hypothetical protein TBR22_A04590 [Luteitalea sp. TBR-22]|uniref:winged helix-turn-helix domain-containing protein n=1 Tax=Luteitalea sp. TBR-22 TaxID=2802971 RepID=UPI001AF9ABB4|nr:winged helix-turn-helix domain-containing protein [Luteitalea sp. TBR-22]BCS31259.1 hypothetical protein TBR22_A04590 [Luteitalea sp. TBR-22]